MATPRLHPVIVQIYGNDPAAFMVGFLRDFKTSLADVLRRTVTRTGVTVVTIDDVDPLKSGKQTKKVKTSPVGSDSPLELGLRIAAMVIAGKGAVFVDEAQRKARGLPIGPKASKALDEAGEPIDIDEVMSDVELQHVPAGTLHRSLFGIDDAIIIGVGVPLLIALLPIIIPMLMEAGKAIFEAVSSSSAPAAGDLPAGSAGDGGGGGGGGGDGGGFLAGTVDIPVIGAIDKKIVAGAAALAAIVLVVMLRRG